MDRSCRFLVVILSVLMVPSLISSVAAQGHPQSPYSARSVLRGRLDLAPSNPLGLPGTTGGMPRGTDSIYLTDQMFRDNIGPIPNLQVGYLYSFGKSVGAGRLTLDYLLPLSLGSDSAVFGEAHGEFTNFWKTVQRLFRGGNTITTQSSFNERTDLSLGGGYRTILNENTLLGVNGFFDTTKLGSRWYSSGGVGFEFAALLPGYDAVDLTFNWYGNLFNSNVLANAFRRGPQNYDFQAGYSHELWDGGPDLRLHATGYKFSSTTGVYGLRGGAELKSPDGMFSVQYEASDDRINGTYHSVGGFVNVGLQIENLLVGESPFTAPEPIFRSPRNLRKYLTGKVYRLFWQPAAASTGTSCTCPGEIQVAPGTYNESVFYPWTGSASVNLNPINVTWCGVTQGNSGAVLMIQIDDTTTWLQWSGTPISSGEGSMIMTMSGFAPTSGLRQWRYVGGGGPIIVGPGGCIGFDFQ